MTRATGLLLPLTLLVACDASSPPAGESAGGTLTGWGGGGAAGAQPGAGGAIPVGAAGGANSSGAGSGAAGVSSSGAVSNSGGASHAGGADSHGGAAGATSSLAGAAALGGVAGAAGTGAGGMGESGWTFPAGVTKPRIMIVGDSISAGPGCYKKYLLKDLTDNGYTKFEFVGEYTDDCGGGVLHSAVSCSTAEQYTHDMFMMPNCQQGKTFLGMSPLAAKHKPDLIMLQLGVNDVWGGATTQTTLDRYETLIEQARAQNPRVALVVAQIQKIRPNCGSDDSVQKRAEELVKAVPAWAQQLGTEPSPVFVADLWTNSDWSKAETLDCVHPNDVGAQKMGMNWFNALKSILPHG
jgi:hypothetical protein